MQSFLLKDSSKETLTAALNEIRGLFENRRVDITPITGVQDIITPAGDNEEEQPATYSSLYFKSEVVFHDDLPPPSWPVSVSVETIEKSSFAFAEEDKSTIEAMPVLNKRQLLLGLLKLGKTEKDVLAIIAQIPDPLQAEVMRIWFEHTPLQIHRNNEKVVALISAMGLNADVVDATWYEAAEL